MQAVELRELKIDPRLRAKLLQAQYLTAAEVLLSPPAAVARRAKLSLFEASQIVSEIAEAACKRNEHEDVSLATLLDGVTVAGTACTTGDGVLDELFGGGLRIGSITEVAGHSSSGKTHLALQTSLTCQLPPSLGGLAGGALFISSEGTVPSGRLLSLAEGIVAAVPSDHDDLPISPWDLLDNVHTEKAPDVETLDTLLSYHVPAAIERINALAAAGATRPSALSPSADPLPSQFLSQNRQTPPQPPLPVRLIVVDSIAAPFRAETETGSSGFAVRARDFAQLGDTLKRLAHVYNCAVLVINQVTDVFDSRAPLPPAFRDDDLDDSSALAVPAANASIPPTVPFPSSALPLTRSNTSSSTQSGSSSTCLPPPHRQLNFPSHLYSRFQSQHFSGADASSPYRTASSAAFILPFAPSAPVSAALGHSWSTIPNVRVLCLLKRGTSSSSRTRRAMSLVFSPFAFRAAVEYEITDEAGLRSIGGRIVRHVTMPASDAAEEGEPM
ncbi:hypothetical protein JCM11251_007014 [Rhodosporidiobolus azoricus]